MDVIYKGVEGAEKSFSVPSELEAGIVMYAAEFGLSISEVVISCLRAGWISIVPKDPLYEILIGMASYDKQAFIKRIFKEHNGGPLVGSVPGTENHLIFNWEDGRFFIAVTIEIIDGVEYFFDSDGNKVTAKSIHNGSSPHIKKGPSPFSGD
jgi:hypothetical protein